ncbi:hypothetical protein FF80_03607 [Devosia sp. LC5]|uniref:DUF4326 domain-containing protein n=1 Tax=Devosia sp. LC5 TaxID=1502724 RepID=UPI0004E2B270|nr:DUF4326 domain-containing protein [Devosia sp. LC5]KFC62512.1 hypothetical protein FF80_03607 [Devosia sp. LC5]
MTPQRIVLSRRAGFDLQALSHALNGLPAQSVARPGRWGNPFTIDDVVAELGVDGAKAQAEAVARYSRWVRGELVMERAPPALEEIRAALAGRNLACWCKAGTPCHADTLIALANA